MPQVTEKCAAEAGWMKTKAGWKNPQGLSFNLAGKPHLRAVEDLPAHTRTSDFPSVHPEVSYSDNRIAWWGGDRKSRSTPCRSGCGSGEPHTVFAQMAALCLKCISEKVHLIVSDTALTESLAALPPRRMTFMAGNSIYGAAEAALTKWKNEERPAIATYHYRPPKNHSF